MTDQLSEYRKRVLRTHRKAVDSHAEVLGTVEAAMMTPRAHSTVDRLVLDMLLLQGLKSDGAVLLLAQHGLMEDTATIARRLMELSVTAVYIGAEPDTTERRQGAGMYLSFMWRQVPGNIRKRLPSRSRRRWSTIARRYDQFVSDKARQWGPKWFDMFKEIGAEDLYRKDYSFFILDCARQL